MSSSRPPIVAPDKLREEISAYLDGELSAEDGREVEERLAAEPHFREELQGLDRAWRLLDELPRAEANEKFASTTVEMVAVRAAEELHSQQQQWPGQYLRGWGISGLGMLLALFLGFGVIAGGAALLSSSGLAPDANRRLLRDLSVLENLDQYQQIDSIDSLRRLADSRLFAAELPALPGEDNGASQGAPVGSTVAERTAYVQRLRPYQRKELAERLERLAALPSAAQEQLRQLDSQLAADPRAEELRPVLTRYCVWLNSLSLDARAELRALPLDERLPRIAQIRKREEEKLVRQQGQHDVRVTLDWVRQFAEKHATALRQQMMPQQQKELEEAAPGLRSKKLMAKLLQDWQRHGFAADPQVSAEDFSNLKGQLSPALRERMEKEGGNMAAQWRVLTAALVEEVRSRMPPEARNRLESAATQSPWSLLMAAATEFRAARGRAEVDDLMRFFHDRLSPEEQASFKRLPRDEFLRKLKARYATGARDPRERGDVAPDRREGPDGPFGFERPRPPHHGGEFRGPPRPDGEGRGPGGPGGPGGRGPGGPGMERGGPRPERPAPDNFGSPNRGQPEERPDGPPPPPPDGTRPRAP